MRIGIFGLGLIGKVFARKCLAAGFEVAGFSRSKSVGAGRIFDARETKDCADLAGRADSFDATVTTFPPQDIAPRFWEAVLSTGGLSVLLGTTSVYQRLGNRPEIDESTPCKRDHDRYPAERQFQAGGGVLVRLAGIYGGPRDPVAWIESGRVGYEDRQVNLVHCQDIADALVLICQQGARQPLYNLSDGRRHTWRQIIDHLVDIGRIHHDKVPSPPKRPDAFVSNRRFLVDYPGFNFRDLLKELAH